MTVLTRDPGSWTAAALSGWAHPMPRLEAMVADLWDLTYKAAGPKKPVQYPRPWPEQKPTRQKGDAAGRTPEQVKALLARARAGLSEATLPV